MVEYKDRKLIQIIDIACSSDININEKIKEKLWKYLHLAFEIRVRRPGYHVEIAPAIIRCMEKV